MAQDLRELFKKEREKKFPLKAGHEERFLERLDKVLPQQKKPSFWFLRIAAAVLVLVTAGIFTYQFIGSEKQVPEEVVNTDKVAPAGQTELSLGDLSPDLKKVENYYLASINMELSKLVVSEGNKILVDGFMERLATLNEEYEVLNRELNEFGPNDQVITALVKNLQLRLQLLLRLKEKINELKSSENEQFTENSL